ncbi:sigma-70 family RNA polymerase sigma factor [bacterium]|nr:sigma-70 family RNA polymerase sigma factor [bacterium]MCK4598109.1 sigma-70 family RNA polymerase sigma factor [bacterium]
MPNPSAEQTEALQTTDAQLIRELKGGRKKSFDQLVLRHQRRIYAITFRMTANHHDADDLAQETFLAAYRALDRFDERQSFAAYISRIAINLSINHLRRKKRWLKIWTQGRREVGKALLGAKDPGPQKNLEQKELLHRLNQAMETLPAHQKAVLVLKVYQEMSYEEIAMTLKISTGTVMSRLHRARSRLHVQIKDLI